MFEPEAPLSASVLGQMAVCKLCTGVSDGIFRDCEHHIVVNFRDFTNLKTPKTMDIVDVSGIVHHRLQIWWKL